MEKRGGGSGGGGGGWLSEPTEVGLASWKAAVHSSEGRAWTDIYTAEGTWSSTSCICTTVLMKLVPQRNSYPGSVTNAAMLKWERERVYRAVGSDN